MYYILTLPLYKLCRKMLTLQCCHMKCFLFSCSCCLILKGTCAREERILINVIIVE